MTCPFSSSAQGKGGDVPQMECPYMHPKRKDVASKRPFNPMFRFGMLGVVHAVSAAVAILLLWIEFARHAVSGFSLDECAAVKSSGQAFGIAAMWTSSATVATISAGFLPFQRWVFSGPRMGDPGDLQQSYNLGRALAGLQYYWLAARVAVLPAWPWLWYADLAILLFLLKPLLLIWHGYPHTIGAFFEWFYLVQMVLLGNTSPLLTSTHNACYVYHQSVMWAMMILDGFFAYTLYSKGVMSIKQVRQKTTVMSTSNVLALCIMWWRAFLNGTDLAPIFIHQVIGRHINLGMFPFGVYKSGSFGQFAHCALWMSFVAISQPLEATCWALLSLMFFLCVWHSRGDITLASKLRRLGNQLGSAVLAM